MSSSGSILLNPPPNSPALLPRHLPSSSSYPASTISTASSSADVHIYRSASVPTRRIRFAPLPETRTSDTVDTPTRTDSPQSIPTPSSPTPTASIISNSSKSKSKPHFLRQLNIFKRSPLTSPIDSLPTSRFSTDDLTSRILRRPRTPDLGLSLSRTTSSREPKRPSTAPSRSSAHSLGAGGGRHPMPPSRSTNPTPTSTPQARATVPKKTGIRMLNGRVYGSKHNSNPFDNVRDEPEFVEWGYGGMGSVVATGTPAHLSHAHPQKVAVGGGRGGAARAAVESKDTAEDDDGSGLSWLRKRREERERLAREKEVQARRASGTNRSSLDNPVSSTPDTDSRRTSTDGSSALDTDLSTLAASSAPTTPPSAIDVLPPTVVDPEDQQEQHILQAVRLSPKHTHHHPSHHRWPSAQAHSSEHKDLLVGTTVGILESDKNDQSPTSESSSDADGEEETLKEDDDEESESELTEDQRKTSLGAGVEKISRHKELARKDGDR